MAFANKPAADLTYTFKDASGSIGKTVISIPFATSTTAALAASDVLRPLVDALSGCSIIGQSLTYSYADDAPAAPDAGSRVEDKGVFVWRLANARTARFEIPGIKDSTLNLSGSINRSDVGVAALVTAVTAVDAIFCGADGSDIRSLLEAYQRFRRSGKRQLPTDR